MNSPKTIAIIGAGNRGEALGHAILQYAHLGAVIAVVEPREAYRRAAASRHNINPSQCYEHWQELLDHRPLPDAVVVTTPDRAHVAPAVAFLNAGCDLLLEKPMGVSLEECRAIEEAQRRSGRIVGVCHSLRYQVGFRRTKELIAAGAVGRIMSIDLVERVGIWHYAHSYVRGNWGNESRSSFMLLAKSCHDIDYLAYLTGTPCRRVSSFGHLSYFRAENAPEGATDRCTDNCPHEPTCPFSAIRQYVTTDRTRWPASLCGADHSTEAHLHAIQTGPYGRCAWKADNDVVDHQVVNLDFDSDITAVFTMTAFTQHGGRRLRVYGTEGELEFDETTITIRTYRHAETQVIELPREHGGHGGGDIRVAREWLTALHTRDDRPIVANAQESLRSHTIVFAAEASRRSGKMVNLAQFEQSPCETR